MADAIKRYFEGTFTFLLILTRYSVMKNFTLMACPSRKGTTLIILLKVIFWVCQPILSVNLKKKTLLQLISQYLKNIRSALAPMIP
jgi:hypothetical protein